MKEATLLLWLLSSAVTVSCAQTKCFNRCLNFDGKDDYVRLATSPVLGNVDFTIEGWFRSLDKDGLTNCPDRNFERIIGCGGSRLEIGECAGIFAVAIGPDGYRATGIATGDAKWHHFALTKNGNAFRVYLDGSRVLAYDLPAGNVFHLNNNFYIGRGTGKGTGTENWQGDIDEIRIWDGALPEEAVRENSTCKLRGNEPGLLAYYNFDQKVAAPKNTGLKYTLTDLTGTHHNGSLHGFAFIGNISNWICSEVPIGTFCDDPYKDLPLPVSPENNSTFQVGGMRLSNFVWKWNGVQPAPIAYHLEVFRHDPEGRRVVFGERVAGTSVSPTAVFNKKLPVPGIYEWRITDTLSGRQSPPAYFTLAPAGCANIGASLKLGDRDWTPDGWPAYGVALTLTNTSMPGTSGCDVTLSSIIPPEGGGSISAISPPLAATIAPGSSQVFNFTFIPASLAQTNINVLCFGTRQSPEGNSVNLQVNAPLPPALYEDCSKNGIAVNALTISPGTVAGVFNLAGNLTTALPGPITAVEFQVQSVSFSALPPSCTEGITGVEKSGVITGPASTINGSKSLIYFNETASLPTQLPDTNNRVAKDVKWVGDLPANSTIPFQLALGLPSVMAGLNPESCKMHYRVRIKATVSYADEKNAGNCRACSVEFRKEFTN